MAILGFLSRNLVGQERVGWYIPSAGEGGILANQEYAVWQRSSEKERDSPKQTKAEGIHHY